MDFMWQNGIQNIETEIIKTKDFGPRDSSEAVLGRPLAWESPTFHSV